MREMTPALMPGSHHDKLSFEVYTRWLWDHVSTSPYYSHRNLFLALNNHEFYWSIQNDSNRAEDGLSLREYYNDIYPEERIFEVMDSGCTVLEALVAMAQRAEMVMYDRFEGDQTHKWFWLFLDNLDIAMLDDYHWENYGLNYLDDVLDIWLDRKFAPDGHGSPFPVENGNDIRKTTMWDALQWYLADLWEEESYES